MTPETPVTKVEASADGSSETPPQASGEAPDPQTAQGVREPQPEPKPEPEPVAVKAAPPKQGGGGKSALLVFGTAAAIVAGGAVLWKMNEGRLPTGSNGATVADSAESNAAQEETAQLLADPAAQTAYLMENNKRDGVVVTETGLQYRVLTASGSQERPAAQDCIKVHYAGRLIDGSEFDSSYARGEPAQFPLNKVIAGWTEGLQFMAIGDKFELTIPSYLGYGEGGAGDVIPPGATLVFDVELIENFGPLIPVDKCGDYEPPEDGE